MKRQARWKLSVVVVLVLGTLSLSSAGIASLASGTGPLTFAETHDRRAYDLLVRSSEPLALDAAAAEANLALAMSPYNNSARLRLAYIDTLRHRSLGPIGLAHLARSYDLVPLDYTVAAWRVRFGLEHWSELSPELRKAVQAEAMAFGRVGSQDADVRSSLQSIRDPAGRLTAALWWRALTRSPPSP